MSRAQGRFQQGCKVPSRTELISLLHRHRHKLIICCPDKAANVSRCTHVLAQHDARTSDMRYARESASAWKGNQKVYEIKAGTRLTVTDPAKLDCELSFFIGLRA